MYMASANPEIRAALKKAHHQRSLTFWSLFRRTRPSRPKKVQGSGLAAA